MFISPNSFSKCYRHRSMVIIFIGLIASSNSYPQDILFEDDFKEPVTNAPNPVWTWGLHEDVREGMMIGEDDIYEVVEGEQFLTHRRSLRLNFSGRNNHCNTCGGDYAEISEVTDEKACLITRANQHESYVYNLDNNFTTWRISDISSDGVEVCLNTNSPIDNAINNGTPQISQGDSIYLPYVCGVNGVVGRNIKRRSDCDKAINYLNGISSEHLGYGESISKRFYMYIPKDTKLPEITFKLGYTAWYRDGKVNNSALKVSVQRDRALELGMPNGERHGTMGSFHVPLGEWVYFEELFKRESSEGAEDAEYTVWASPADNYDPTPIKKIDGFTLGQLRRMSIGGNWQHHEDVNGYVYFDNIVIAKDFVGPVNRPVIEK